MYTVLAKKTMKLTLRVSFLVVAYSATCFAEKMPTSDQNNSKWSSYINKEYGFRLSYPAYLTAAKQFSTSYFLSSKWSVNSDTENNQLQHALFEIQLQNTHGRDKVGDEYHYQSFVRIGVSTSSSDMATCEKPTNIFERSKADESKVINGKKFYIFTFSDAGMMKYISGIAYRHLDQNKCYSIEYVESGSNSNGMLNYSLIQERNKSLAEKIINTIEGIK